MGATELLSQKNRLLRRTGYGTRVEGVRVVLTIGHREVVMGYQEALTLSAFLRNSGRLAKRNAGDTSTSMVTFARLTDGNLEEMKAQRSRDGTAVFVPPER